MLLGSVIFVGSVFGTVVASGGLQRVVTSVFCRLLVIPISFRYASPANASKLACWSCQPKRPIRSLPSLSGTSTLREPDAGNLPVRFDEREQEAEPSQTGLRWRGESKV